MKKKTDESDTEKGMQVVFWILGALLLFLLLFIFAVMPRRKREAAEPFLQTHYAHRGLWGEGVAENSLSAFSSAVEAGYGIELDVQLSADGEVVVFHDESLARVTGCEGSLYEKELSFLKTLCLSGTKDTIPTLREVLALVDGKVPLLIEIKSDHAWRTVCEKTAALLDSYTGAYCIESFHPLCVAWFRKHREGIVRGQLSARLWKEKKHRTLPYLIVQNLLLNFYARPDFIAYDFRDRNYFAFRLALLWQPYTFAWTVKSAEEAKKARRFDALIFEGKRTVQSKQGEKEND